MKLCRCSFSYDVMLSVVLCVSGDADRHVSAFTTPYSPYVHSFLEAFLTCPEQEGRQRDSPETELSAILLSFIECEAKQENRTAVSSLTQREADEEQKREKRESGRKSERERELSAL